jgi:hypothetical protein
MAHLDVSPLQLPSTPVHYANASSPDESCMVEAFDGDGFPYGDKPQSFHYADGSSATTHALEVLASLDDYGPVNPHAQYPPPDGASEFPRAERARTGPKTKMTVEEKKRRNRDCMRRLRNRRNDLVSTMRLEIQELEAHLNRQMDLSQGSGSHHPENPESPDQSRRQALQQLEMDHVRIKTAMRRLREENYWLQKQIEQRQEFLTPLQQVVQDESPLIDLDAIEREEMGDWIRNTHHFIPPLEEARACEIVMESYRIIQEGVRLSEKIQSSPNAVLGWSDQRSVDRHWANFMMRKTFPHERPRQLALKTWDMLSRPAEISAFQPKAYEMKVLQRLNEFTLVVARRTYFEHTKLSYCMVYLLFLLETDSGFVIGSRSLDPDESRMQAFVSERTVVAKPFHCFHIQSDRASGGATVTFAGRVDNVIEGCARGCAMDMLLAMMRWENHCVSPLWHLTT